jgi:AcrR family transcriptional regulator
MVRLRREDREKQIVAGAISFFAEHGFAGQTRELAKMLGITQPLLYRYFPSKQALIDRVYEELFLSRWNPAWEVLLTDRSRQLPDRIRVFYLDFCETIFSREWVRMFVYAGLDHVPYNHLVLQNIQRRVLRRICAELRVHFGYADVRPDRVSALEIEYAWELHGVAFYYHVRKYVYALPANQEVSEMIDLMVETFMAGAPNMLSRALGPRDAAASA